MVVLTSYHVDHGSLSVADDYATDGSPEVRTL